MGGGFSHLCFWLFHVFCYFCTKIDWNKRTDILVGMTHSLHWDWPDPDYESIFFTAGLFQALTSLWHSYGEGSAEATSRFRGLADPASALHLCVLPLLPCKEEPGLPAMSTGEGSTANTSRAKKGNGHRRWAPKTAAETSAQSISAPH